MALVFLDPWLRMHPIDSLLISLPFHSSPLLKGAQFLQLNPKFLSKNLRQAPWACALRREAL